jgi:hypothetical protein
MTNIFAPASTPTATLRYYDTFAKMDGTWLFAERLLYVDWIEERVLS